MRAAQLAGTVEELIGELFEHDVAAAIIGCEVFPKLVRVLNYDSLGSPDEMARLLRIVADEINGTGTADWLVESAITPAAFIISRIR